VRYTVGNEGAVKNLIEEFPPVALLWGPTSVGKWTAAEQARREHMISEPDVIRVKRLTISQARDIVRFTSVAPSTVRGKVAIINLDGAHTDALNVLLKPLEESDPSVHFMLIASALVPPTIRTRARQYSFGLLTEAEIAQILVADRGLSASAATRLAGAAGGQVKKALSVLVAGEDKSLVLTALRSVREGNLEALGVLADRWRDEHTALLVDACTEAVSEQWRMFSRAEVGEVPDSVLLRILMAVRKDVRPRLVIRSSLMDVVRASA